MVTLLKSIDKTEQKHSMTKKKNVAVPFSLSLNRIQFYLLNEMMKIQSLNGSLRKYNLLILEYPSSAIDLLICVPIKSVKDQIVPEPMRKQARNSCQYCHLAQFLHTSFWEWREYLPWFFTIAKLSDRPPWLSWGQPLKEEEWKMGRKNDLKSFSCSVGELQ